MLNIKVGSCLAVSTPRMNCFVVTQENVYFDAASEMSIFQVFLAGRLLYSSLPLSPSIYVDRSLLVPLLKNKMKHIPVLWHSDIKSLIVVRVNNCACPLCPAVLAVSCKTKIRLRMLAENRGYDKELEERQFSVQLRLHFATSFF